MKVAAVMPAKGRPTQTLDAARRLLCTAGLAEHEWQLVIICDDDRSLYNFLRTELAGMPIVIKFAYPRVGYWYALSLGASLVPDATHLVNLANDLLPGGNWLARMMETVKRQPPGVTAFNDGIHAGSHAAHFCADVPLLRKWYGGSLVPLCYDHMFGDAEISTRAQQEQCFFVSPWSVLYHNHVYVGNALDEIYKLGHAHTSADQETYNRRRANGWRD